jgi:hypothetical protein
MRLSPLRMRRKVHPLIQAESSLLGSSETKRRRIIITGIEQDGKQHIRRTDTYSCFNHD